MNEKDPLLDELEERIAEGPVIFTPDEEFLKRVEEKTDGLSEDVNEVKEQLNKIDQRLYELTK